jgi:hypothetical protein
VAEGSEARNILILGDDARVLKVVQAALPPEYRATHAQADCIGRRTSLFRMGDFDLIVLALSSYASEPIVALGHALVSIEFGRVPILIASDRPFLSDETNCVFYTGFPFTAEQLCACVRRIMMGQEQNSTLVENPGICP